MPIRNPFSKRPDVQTGLQPPSEDYVRPLSQNGTKPTFEKVDTVGSKASSAMSIKSGRSQEPAEYKMSGMFCDFGRKSAGLIDHLPQTVVNDSGVYLPVSSRQFSLLSVHADVSKPSPPEKKSFWPRRTNPSGTSTGTRDSESEIEAFPISRESFDSYRRSFVGVPGF